MDSQDRSSFLVRLGNYRRQALDVMRMSLPETVPGHDLYDIVREYLERSGKGLRPALCLATCRAFGGRTEDALNSAAAIEMLHNAFLVHDDIEDGSEFRRGHPTMHTKHGVPIAVNTGDAMQALSMRLLAKNRSTLGPELAWQVFEEFDHMLIESLEGQAIELEWIRSNRCDISDDDYLRMILKKTSWYSFIHPCRIGALIARPDDANLDRFNSFGNYLGSAFQIQDDILNLTGSRQKYGKEIAGDLYEGKRTLMLAHLFENCSQNEKQTLKKFLFKARNGKYADQIDGVMELLKTHGSIEYARNGAHELHDAAEEAFLKAYKDAPESEDKKFIQQSLSYLIERSS